MALVLEAQPDREPTGEEFHETSPTTLGHGALKAVSSETFIIPGAPSAETIDDAAAEKESRKASIGDVVIIRPLQSDKQQRIYIDAQERDAARLPEAIQEKLKKLKTKAMVSPINPPLTATTKVHPVRSPETLAGRLAGKTEKEVIKLFKEGATAEIISIHSLDEQVAIDSTDHEPQ